MTRRTDLSTLALLTAVTALPLLLFIPGAAALAVEAASQIAAWIYDLFTSAF